MHKIDPYRLEVAVIIPTFNEENHIERCLESVARQSYPFEKMDVMVIDGGSKDRTCEIVLDYCREHANVRLLDNPKRIQAAAFNIGVANSSASIIVRMDAHALYHEYYIEGCVTRLLEDDRRGNVGGQWDIQPQNDSKWAVANAILNSSKFGIGGATYRVGAQAGNVDTVPFGAFPRRVIEEIGGMREDLARGEDNEFNSRIKKAGYDIFFDPRIVCTYYARPTLRASCKQMYANGVSIGQLFYIDKKAIAIRHFVPLVFVLALAFSVAGAIVWRPLLWLFVVIVASYLLCAVLASISPGKKYGWKYLVLLPVMFLSVHCSYGWGTLVGLVKNANKY